MAKGNSTTLVHRFKSGTSLKVTATVNRDADAVGIVFVACDGQGKEIGDRWKKAPKEIMELHTRAIAAFKQSGIIEDPNQNTTPSIEGEPIVGQFTYAPSQKKSSPPEKAVETIVRAIEASLKPLEFTPSLAEAVAPKSSKPSSRIKTSSWTKIEEIITGHTGAKMAKSIVADLKEKMPELGGQHR